MITVVDPLDRDALVRILVEPKNSLVRQFQQMFALDGVSLEFTKARPQRFASTRETGARGLRSIIELRCSTIEVPSFKGSGQAGRGRRGCHSRAGAAEIILENNRVLRWSEDGKLEQRGVIRGLPHVKLSLRAGAPLFDWTPPEMW